MPSEAPRLRAVPCRYCRRLDGWETAEFTATCENVELELATRGDATQRIGSDGRMSMALAAIIVDAVNTAADRAEEPHSHNHVIDVPAQRAADWRMRCDCGHTAKALPQHALAMISRGPKHVEALRQIAQRHAVASDV